MPRRIIERIRERIRLGQYDMTRHAVEEMAEDNLDIFDVECAVLSGKLTKKEKGHLRGTKYTLVGTSSDQQRLVGMVGRFTNTGRFLIITVYEVKDL